MPAVSWVPLSDEVASRLAARARAENLTLEALAARILAAYAEALSDESLGTTTADATDTRPTQAILIGLEEAIEQHWRENPDQRSGVENILMAALALQREVNNGGFDQFFRNSSRRWASFAPDAMLHIGRKDAARIAKRALRAVGRYASPAELDEKMNTPNSRRDEILNECDIDFYQLTEIPDFILQYARRHTNGLLRK